jgi:agmatine deiminase
MQKQKKNKTFFSQSFKSLFLTQYNAIIDIMCKYEISHSLIHHTKDIWCRDYMPVQVNQDKFVQFRYQPSYLKEKKYDSIRTNPADVEIDEKINIIHSDIVLDGGNVLKCGGKAILSSRIFNENPNYEKKHLLAELERLLEAEIIIIPQINCDMTGHADGYVRFYNENTLLVNELEKEYKYWRKEMEKVFSRYNFNYIEIPWFLSKKKCSKSAVGRYINFLDAGNVLILPKFEVEGNRDVETYQLFQKLYPNKSIELLNINPIAEEGGLFHCITWEIEKKLP